MSCKFVLDAREGQLKTLLQNKIEDLNVLQLDVGDVQIIYNDTPVVIIERKSLSDLVQSIKDNRYKEQKTRLLSVKGSSKYKISIMYVIEGLYSFAPSFTIRGISNKALVSSIVNMIFRDGIFVLLTKNTFETGEFLTSLYERFKNDPDKYLSENNCLVYSETLVKPKKKDNITQNICLHMQITAIPGISTKKANDIMDHYQVKTIKDLCDKITFDSLVEIKGIGTKLARTILEHLGIP